MSRFRFLINAIVGLLLVVNANANPLPRDDKNINSIANSSEIISDDSDESQGDYDLIDQRQKGKENYRINLKDVFFLYAPAETLLSAATLLDSQIFGDLEGGSDFAWLEGLPDGNNQQHPGIINILTSSTTQKPITTTTTAKSTTVQSTTTEKLDMKPEKLSPKLRYPALLASLIRRRPEQFY